MYLLDFLAVRHEAVTSIKNRCRMCFVINCCVSPYLSGPLWISCSGGALSFIQICNFWMWLSLEFLKIKIEIKFWKNNFIILPFPVAARSKAWVCDRSLAGIAGANLTGAWMFVCFLWVLCIVRYRSMRRADHSSRGFLPNVVCRCVWSRNLMNEEAVAHRGLSRQKYYVFNSVIWY